MYEDPESRLMPSERAPRPRTDPRAEQQGYGTNAIKVKPPVRPRVMRNGMEQPNLRFLGGSDAFQGMSAGTYR